MPYVFALLNELVQVLFVEHSFALLAESTKLSSCQKNSSVLYHYYINDVISDSSAAMPAVVIFRIYERSKRDVF